MNKTECELGGYKWVSQIATKEMYFDIVVTDENYQLSDVEVDVVVTSTYPYKKTISGNFILHKRNIEEEAVTFNASNRIHPQLLVIFISFSPAFK